MVAAAVALASPAAAMSPPAREHPRAAHKHHAPPRPRPKRPHLRAVRGAALSTTCSSDATAGLASLFNAAPAGSTVTLAKGACFLVNSTLIVQNLKNVSINANGSTFRQTVSPGAPMVELWHDTSLTITNLTIQGADTSGAESGEINYGVVLEADNGVVLAADTIEDTGGDWVYLSPDYDVPGGAKNTGIVFAYDTFYNAGYHGFTVESVGCPTTTACNGLNVAVSKMTNIQVDAMDFEVDDYGSDYTGAVPNDFAQDYVTINNNTWTNWNGSDWFASLQGQVTHTDGCPSSVGCGVSQQHVTLSNNTLVDNAPFLEIVGSELNAAGLNKYLTVTGNHYAPGYTAKPYRGGTSPSTSIENIIGLTMTNNTVPWCPGVNYPACDGSPPSEYAMGLTGIAVGTIANNNFSGALGVQDPAWGHNFYYVKFCGNAYGIGGAQNDGAC